MKSPRNTGRKWERECAIQNQRAYDEHGHVLTRMATHYHGGIPSSDPKLDFIGALSDGRCIAYDAKSGTGRLTREQRNFAAALARAGAVVFVYHSDGYVRMVDGAGELGEKIYCTTWMEVIG